MKEAIELYDSIGALQPGPHYLVELGIDFYDIAYIDDCVWYALGDSEHSIEVYNSSGVLVNWIPSSIVPAARGLKKSGM